MAAVVSDYSLVRQPEESREARNLHCVSLWVHIESCKSYILEGHFQVPRK